MAEIHKSRIEFPSAVERLAEALFTDMERLDPSGTLCQWTDLDEGAKELYRTLIEGLIVQWHLIERAHRELLQRV